MSLSKELYDKLGNEGVTFVKYVVDNIREKLLREIVKLDGDKDKDTITTSLRVSDFQLRYNVQNFDVVCECIRLLLRESWNRRLGELQVTVNRDSTQLTTVIHVACRLPPVYPPGRGYVYSAEKYGDIRTLVEELEKQSKFAEKTKVTVKSFDEGMKQLQQLTQGGDEDDRTDSSADS